MLSCIPIPSSRTLLYITTSILCFLGVATSRPTQNITIEVPSGTTNHGELNSLCTPTTWSDIASYLLFNYVAHGATVVSYPGEAAFDMLLCIVAAILFPTYGVIRALNFIVRHPLLPLGKNDLEVAARSGALCVLVRSSSWKPQKGDNIRNALIEDPDNEPSRRGRNTSPSDPSTNISQPTAALSIYTPPWLNDRTQFWSYTDTHLVKIGSRVVFGLSKPPDQYSFAFVPRNTEVLGLVDPTPTPSSNVPDIPLLRSLYRNRIFASPISTPRLSSSFNLVRGMAALLQSLYASFTLYHSIGGQVNQYGFAAPGLTVLPYAVMSALNLMASLVAPHYPTMYLVRSKVMEEAERRTGLPFRYVVGEVVDESDTDNIVMEGWSEVAGSFMDDDKLLHVSHSAEEDEKIEICDSSRQRIYVPACPRFRRTDDTQTSPLRRFNKTRRHGLEFPRYMARRRQALIQLSSQLQGCVRALRRYLLPYYLQQQYQKLTPTYMRLLRLSRQNPLNPYEIYLIASIANIELFTTLGLSNFSGQQSTLAQRAWTVTWFLAGYLFGAVVAYTSNTIFDGWPDVSPVWLRFVVCCSIVIYSPPAIGGFVAVFQMLKAYGICYKFV